MTDAAQAHPGHGSKGYRAYVLGALLIVYTFNFIDRVVIGIVGEPIKEEFGLTYFQLGLLGGPMFAVLYTLLGIPIARFAERSNRMTILAVCLALWSAATAACGFAVNYLQLCAARIGVSIGEAGCTPPANSVISDYFPSERRASALSIYALGIPIGSMIAAVGGAWIAQNVGWREAFIWLGVPGVALAVIVKLTVKEPPRSAAQAEAPSFISAVAALAKKPTFWHVALGSALASFVGYGVGQFLTNFMIRVHGFTLFEAGSIIGAVLGLCAAIGTFASGFLADRIAKRHPNALAWLPALGFAIATPLYLLSFFLADIRLALPALCVAAICHYFYLGPMYAVTQGVVVARMRAIAVAVLLFIVNLIGYALGPPVIGAIADAFTNNLLGATGLSVDICEAMRLAALGKEFHQYSLLGQELPAPVIPPGADIARCNPAIATGLRWAMMIGVCGYLWAGLHFLLSARTLRRDWVA
ncbi:spinster family MFS transporter [Terricaulis sp.]|uniref:spinster family MFS transporter n=1 Tax=Terricaulis sp. TaxID=2768686 RepID=UPI00378456E8